MVRLLAFFLGFTHSQQKQAGGTLLCIWTYHKQYNTMRDIAKKNSIQFDSLQLVWLMSVCTEKDKASDM